MLTKGILNATTSDLVSVSTEPTSEVGVILRPVPALTFGMVPNVTPNSVPGVTGNGIQQRPMRDFYYRIWVIPSLMRLNNPQLNVPIEFGIFNAYPVPNTLTSIVAVNAMGVVLSFTSPQAYREVELKTVTLSINDSAPAEVAADFIFNFSAGQGLFRVEGVIADFVQMVPDPPIIEKMVWLTDVIQTWGGAEQRIALRGNPRRRISYTIPIESVDDRRRQYLHWYRSLPFRIVLPFYQYATPITQPSAQGTITVFCDTSRTDLRVDDFAILYDTTTNIGYFLKVATISSDRFTVETPLQTAATPRMVVAPMLTCRLFNKTGPAMRSMTGEVRVEAEALEFPTIVRPGSSPTITRLDDIAILNRRPIIDGSMVDEKFDAGYEVIDSDTGNLDIKTAWAHPFIEGARQFLVQRTLQPGEMDWWRAFLNECRGQQRAFYLPTWLSDLVPAATPVVESNQFLISGIDYLTRFWPYASYQQLAFTTASGLNYYRKVTAAAESAGNTLLQMAAPFASNEVSLAQVSFLNLVRLGSDEVTLTHEMTTTKIDLTVRTVDA